MYRKQQNERKKNVSNTTGTLVLEVPQTTVFSNEVSGILDSFDLKCHKEALLAFAEMRTSPFLAVTITYIARLTNTQDNGS
jgi:hypothetical protein